MHLAVLAIARNESAFARDFVRSTKEFADEIWVGDMDSTDETAGILKEEGARVLRIPYRSFLERGFGWARSSLLQSVGPAIDWIHWLDLDERVTKEDGETIRDFISDWPRFVETKTFEPIDGFRIEEWREHLEKPAASQRHIRSHPHRPEFHWRGYIHEELYFGSAHALPAAAPSLVRHWHFSLSNPKRDHPKELLYGFMLDRALRIPELQRGTSRWWFEEYVKTLPHEEQAERFRELCPEAREL